MGNSKIVSQSVLQKPLFWNILAGTVLFGLNHRTHLSLRSQSFKQLLCPKLSLWDSWGSGHFLNFLSLDIGFNCPFQTGYWCWGTDYKGCLGREWPHFLWAGTPSYTKIYGHPMDLFLKISVVQANFCWLGGVEEITCPWMESVAGKKIGLGVLGLISRITVMAFFPRRSGCRLIVGALAGWELFHQSFWEWGIDTFFPAICQNA